MRAGRVLRNKIRENREYADEVRQESSLALCAYRRGKGSCSFYCYEEPACYTDEPIGGWYKPWVLGHDRRLPWRKVKQGVRW